MSALLEAFFDSACTMPLTHSQLVATTTAGGTQNAPISSLQVTSTSGMAPTGVIDIDTGANLETIPYTAIIDSTHIQLARVTAINHASGVNVISWYYALNVGDQTNGILNDGSQAAPTSSNTQTYYIKNVGDQTAQNPAFSTSSSSPTTQDSFTDTLISITGSSSGFASVVMPANITAGSVQQIWAVEELPTGRSNIPSTGKICVLNLLYQSV